MNVAVTAVFEVTVIAHGFVLQPPPVQPVNDEPAAAVATRVITVPDGKFAEQVEGQEIPDGELATEPVPEPARVTPSE